MRSARRSTGTRARRTWRWSRRCDRGSRRCGQARSRERARTPRLEPAARRDVEDRAPELLPAAITRDWAFGDSTGKGARVCILDSGVELGHPLVGEVQSAVVVTAGEDGEPRIDEDAEGDVCGHGTACAGIVRALAPEAEIHSVRVLGPGYTGSGKILLAGLRHAIEQRSTSST
jgi:subtilisin family serine protease